MAASRRPTITALLRATPKTLVRCVGAVTALLLIAAHGAAAQSPPASPERPAAVNLEDLAGIWSGVATHGQRDDYVELRIRGDGTYEMTSARQIGVFRGQGVLVPADGGYELRGDSGRTGALEIARDPSGRPVLRLDATIHGGQRVSANLRRAR